MEKEEEIKKVCPMPEELTFRGVRSKILREVWKRADLAEKQGKPLTHEDFRHMIIEEWQKVKAELPKIKAEYEKCVSEAQKKLLVEKEVDSLIEKDKKELEKIGIKS